MAVAGAGDFMRGPLLEGSISGGLTDIERRPYHRNCTCALHGSARQNHCSAKHTKVSYPIRRSWSEGSLALYASSADPSPSSSPANVIGTGHHASGCSQGDPQLQDLLFPVNVSNLM